MKKRNIRNILLILFLLSAGASLAQTTTFVNVKNYGAKGDGTTIDTKAIDQAITATAAAGGGTVFFPAGNYLSVTIHLKSNISLHLDQGATIIAADNGYDLPEKSVNDVYQDYGHSHYDNSLIVGENLENISILGPGKIWGKGLLREETPKPEGEDGKGNKAIALKLCRNVILRDFTIRHGGWFGLLLNAVDNMTIDNLKMDTNRDGIDVISCKNVRISNCLVNSPQDDAICLKSDYALNYARSTENVTITNCQVSGYDEGSLLDGTFKHDIKINRTGRIKFGTESNGGFKNITISNCIFDYSRGLALETVDGALLEDVTITNITMRNIVNSPIFVRLGERMRGPAGAEPSQLRRVMISNIVAYNVDGVQSAIISGTNGHDIEDLTLRNIHIYFKGGGKKEQVNRIPPGLEKEYPEPSRFGITPVYGFYIRNVKGLKMSDIEVSYLNEEQRPAYMLDHVVGAELYHIKAQSTGAETVMLRQVKAVTITDSDPIPNTRSLDTDQKKL